MRHFNWLTFVLATYSTVVSSIYLQERYDYTTHKTEDRAMVEVHKTLPFAAVSPSVCLKVADKETCINP